MLHLATVPSETIHPPAVTSWGALDTFIEEMERNGLCSSQGNPVEKFPHGHPSSPPPLCTPEGGQGSLPQSTAVENSMTNSLTEKHQ